MIDAGGRLVLPGFTDCHIHFLDGSELAARAARGCKGCSRNPEAREGIRRRPIRVSPGYWAAGGRIPAVGPTNLPDKKYLDEIVPDRPVYLDAFDGHTSWANSKALQLAGITREIPILPAARSFVIPRRARRQEPSRKPADALVRHVIPVPSREELAAYRAGFKEANRAGLVACIARAESGWGAAI